MNQGVMMFKRSVWYIIGLNCIALSVVLNIRFDLGVAAFSSVMYAISEIYHISLGMASIICYLIFVVLQCLMSKKVTLVFILEVAARFVCFCLTMFLTAVGVYLCVKSKMVLTPTEGIVNTISEVFHLRFSAVKNAFDISMVIISALLCLLNHSSFYGLGVGTVLSALLLGRIIKLCELLDK